MTETRTAVFKGTLFGKLLASTPDNRAYLLASLVTILYEAAPENTKDRLDAKVKAFGVGLINRETT